MTRLTCSILESVRRDPYLAPTPAGHTQVNSPINATGYLTYFQTCCSADKYINLAAADALVSLIPTHSHRADSASQTPHYLVIKKLNMFYLSLLFHDIPHNIQHIPIIPSGVGNGNFWRASQYHGCWCPGDVSGQAMSSHNTDYTGWTGLCIPWWRIPTSCAEWIILGWAQPMRGGVTMQHLLSLAKHQIQNELCKINTTTSSQFSV